MKWIALGKREESAPAWSNYRMQLRVRNRAQGLTLMEILVVIAIIAILAALYLGPIAKAFGHVKKMFGQ